LVRGAMVSYAMHQVRSVRAPLVARARRSQCRAAAEGRPDIWPLSRAQGHFAAAHAKAVMCAALGVAMCGMPVLAPDAAMATTPVGELRACKVSEFDKFADVRAKFSQEVGGGGLPEATLDLSKCDYRGKDLSNKVFSGAIIKGADFSGGKLVNIEMSRTRAQSANFEGVDLRDANAYSTNFNGANLRDVNFENAILTLATFGQDQDGTWADLTGTNFDGALISDSDIRRACPNPTIVGLTKRQLGCR